MLFLLISNRYSSPSSNQRNLKKSSFRIQFQSLLRFHFFKPALFCHVGERERDVDDMVGGQNSFEIDSSSDLMLEIFVTLAQI